MKIDFTKDAIGTKVWSFSHGWGKIAKINYDDEHPVEVKFPDRTIIFTARGRRLKKDNPILFYREVPIPDECYTKPLPELPVDTRVLVRDMGCKNWKNRHFSHFRGGRCYCFNGGTTSWSEKATTPWNEWKLPESEDE